MKKLIAFSVIVCMGIALLAACSGSQTPENPDDVYRVIVKDEMGAGVKGVIVQLCSDQMCIMSETDDNGIAVFKGQPEGTYTVHVLSVPEGYAEDPAVYAVPEKYGDISITLRRQ
ncbi:MAG: prealbumin-like fold domain-containing protein [Eubacteriales bacterium]|nr:prealbumin-like fold domain-containing protein [Eubacteriales bacterium]